MTHNSRKTPGRMIESQVGLPPSGGAAEPGMVYLVGSGPGSVELLTLRAWSLLTTATCILHDDLISSEVLAIASPSCQVRNVGKRCGAKTITQSQIQKWMIEAAQNSHSVVRLKSGDPLLFGRAEEEMAALMDSLIPFEVVPGVSTGFAAAALAKRSLSGRITNSRVLFATRHLASGDTSGLKGIGPEVTLVLYMPGGDYAAIQRELKGNGWDASSRCVAASAISSAKEELHTCSLAELDQLPQLPAPVIMLFFPGGNDPVTRGS